MACRVLTYVALLYEDLIACKRWNGAGRLPEVIPVVVYNGNRAERVLTAETLPDVFRR